MSSIKNILIAYDGSGSADAAIDDLKKAGLPDSGINATVISVAEVWLPSEPINLDELPTSRSRFHLEGNMELFERLKQANEKAVDRVRNSFPNWTVDSYTTSGSPSWELLFKAGEMKADLIVVGAQGVSAIDRILIGSVSGKVVNEAECSVRVSRGKIDVDNGAPRILVAFDGSAGSHAAIEAIIGRNWPEGTEVKVVIASDSTRPVSFLNLEVDEIEDTAMSIVEKFKAAGLKADKAVIEGSPKKVIVEEAQNWAADCIFVGAAGYSARLTKMLLGTISSAVVTRAHCSVEVVRTK
jgi:nucleotide-binding universal stress UspA family protein